MKKAKLSKNNAQNIEQFNLKIIEKSGYRDFQLPSEFRIRETKNVAIIGENIKRSNASKTKSVESTNRPKFLSQQKIKNKNFIIKRSNTPEIERNFTQVAQ